MLEIKTIINNSAASFDRELNAALADGWELVRRECFVTGSDRVTTLYAELERFAEAEEVDVEYNSASARWELTRKPQNPYRCSSCGYTANEQWATCPECQSPMRCMEE